MVQDFDRERQASAKAAAAALRDAGAESEALRRLVKLKTRELKNVRRLAQVGVQCVIIGFYGLGYICQQKFCVGVGAGWRQVEWLLEPPTPAASSAFRAIPLLCQPQRGLLPQAQGYPEHTYLPCNVDEGCLVTPRMSYAPLSVNVC